MTIKESNEKLLEEHGITYKSMLSEMTDIQTKFQTAIFYNRYWQDELSNNNIIIKDDINDCLIFNVESNFLGVVISDFVKLKDKLKD